LAGFNTGVISSKRNKSIWFRFKLFPFPNPLTLP
jgi:hypothetical protein